MEGRKPTACPLSCVKHILTGYTLGTLGQRLELFAVEHHLTQHPLVTHAAVLYPGQGPYLKQLVALVVLQRSAATDAPPTPFQLLAESDPQGTVSIVQSIEDFTARRLPPHGVPQAIIALSALPLNTSGKLDRTAIAKWLTDMDHRTLARVKSSLAIDLESSPLLNEAETAVVQVWADVLNVPEDQIARASTFIQLGGNSASPRWVRD